MEALNSPFCSKSVQKDAESDVLNRYANKKVLLEAGGEKQMAVKIRLKRMGAKKAPFYRLVVADSRSPRDGRFIEEIGYYNPTTQPVEVKIDEDKALKWLQNGAQPSDTVRNLLNKAGVMKRFHEAKLQK